MKARTILILISLAASAIVLSACSAIAKHHDTFIRTTQTAPDNTADPISGEWNVSFFVHDSKTPATYTLKLDGTKVTGTAYSDHTGAGTVRDGKWENGKLSLTLDFKKHESIAITGAVKDGKLAGEFTTEGFTAKWEATRK